MKLNNCYVYRHIRHDKNEVFYVGYAEKSQEYSCHETEYKRAYSKTRNQYWHNIVALTNYSIEIVMEDLTSDEAYAKEVELISIYGLSRDGGTLCNILPGGRGGTKGYKMSDETKKKIADYRRGKTQAEISDLKRQKELAKLKGRTYTQEEKDHRREISLNALSYSVTCDGKTYKNTYEAAQHLFPDTDLKNAARGITISCKSGKPYKKHIFSKVNPQQDDSRTRGELVHSSKLTEVEVVEIKTRYNSGQKICDLICDYSVSYDTVLHIIQGVTWLHVEPQIVKRTEKWGNKFKESDIPKIIELYQQGTPTRDIAEMYEVHIMAILRILNGKTWNGVGKVRDSTPHLSLTSEQVARIKQLMLDGKSNRDIANKFDIDMSTVQRIKKGETWIDVGPKLNFKTRRGNCKLTHEQVEEIQALLDSGEMVMVVAKNFAVHRDTISKIKNGKTWKEAA